MTEDLELRVVLPPTLLAGGARAEFFSQANCEELLGLPRRRFLELLRRHDAPPVAEVGKLRLVEREPMLAYLRALKKRDVVQPSAAEEEVLDGADRVLQEVGAMPERRRRVG